MERLTFEGNFCDIAQCRELPCPYNRSCSQREVWELLKAYEDTGLTPESVEALKLSMMGKAVSEITEFEGLPIERLKELASADREGRVMVLPCKVGDTVIYQTFAGDPTFMRNIRLEIAYESRCGIIFHMGCGIFTDLVEHGRIKPVSVEAEEALRRAE